MKVFKKKEDNIKKNVKENIKKDNKLVIGLVFRYTLILILGLGNLFLFYLIFTPLTVYPVFHTLKLFYTNSILSNSTIFIDAHKLEIVEACVAGSAYYLLFILNFSVKMNSKKRVLSLLYSFLSLLILNIVRIVFLSFLILTNNSFFDITHKIFWYFLSTFFVVLIWFSEVKIFKIKEIPIYSDIKELLRIIRKK